MGADLPTTKTPLTAEARAKLERDVAEAQKKRDEIMAEGRRTRIAEYKAKADNNLAASIKSLAAVARAQAVEAELDSYDEMGRPKAFCMGVQDKPTREPVRSAAVAERMQFTRTSGFETIADSPLFARGDVDKPGERVPRGFPPALTLAQPPPIPAASSGRRELAEWLAAPQNPLTARVMANRVWHWLMGRGLVASVDNFGTTGQAPGNPALLDFLADGFARDGWSVKRLIKRIVLSHAYQLSTAHDEKSFVADPENTLVWRMNTRRLDAECVRDAMLAASGRLDPAPQAGSVIGRAGDGAIAAYGRGVGEAAILNADGGVRSVYLPIARSVLPQSLAVFDFADPGLVTGAREVTSVPAQALYILNNAFVSAQAQALAERVLAAFPGGPNGGVNANLDQRLALACRLVFARNPDAVERQAAADFFGKFPSHWKKGDTAPAGIRDADAVKAAWASFCRALFASAEFRYLN